ncbi:hypothetical protein L0222_25825 [bacterium]|nr:hypothetical protein [bacterium]MCI0602706.1 hypothetical protein [bacterium]
MKSQKNFGLVALACAIIVCSSSLLLAGDPTVWQLKTPQPNAQKFKPFLDAVTSLKADLEKSKELPANASTRFAQVKNLSGQFEQAVQELSSAIRQNGEIATFDQLVAARLKKAGKLAELAEVNQAGGPFHLFANPKKFVDAELADLSTRFSASMRKPTALETIANITLGSVLQLMETESAHAALYGGGITCRCSVITLIYYSALGVHASYCCY